VYPGDPLLFHARYILLCLAGGPESQAAGRPQDRVAGVRLGGSVKKAVLLAWLEGDEVRYHRLRRGVAGKGRPRRGGAVHLA
jgi:tRNA splicing endonuclease